MAIKMIRAGNKLIRLLPLASLMCLALFSGCLSTSYLSGTYSNVRAVLRLNADSTFEFRLVEEFGTAKTGGKWSLSGHQLRLVSDSAYMGGQTTVVEKEVPGINGTRLVFQDIKKQPWPYVNVIINDRLKYENARGVLDLESLQVEKIALDWLGIYPFTYQLKGVRSNYIVFTLRERVPGEFYENDVWSVGYKEVFKPGGITLRKRKHGDPELEKYLWPGE